MLAYQSEVELYKASDNHKPLFFCGDALATLRTFPAESIDFCMTSPPYWGKREYNNGGLGLEAKLEDYIERLLEIFAEVKRVLKPSGSFWLNLGDSYNEKNLLAIPWRIAIALMDRQNWILRNDVVWNKLKGPDNSLDKLRNVHEYLFHFVKDAKNYYYDVGAIRAKPGQTQVRNGAIVTATGVTGVRYKGQIELSTALSAEEKQNAFNALNNMLGRLQAGEIADFRMVIRNQQRVTHSESEKLSGRAKELAQKGFYFLLYHPDGSKPGDVWEILPEDTTKRGSHYAAYPEDLCRIPILATCPENGSVLDPFCGTATTNLVAFKLGRKSIGIDISEDYVNYARQRCNFLL
jgi:DNA modification methylase